VLLAKDGVLKVELEYRGAICLQTASKALSVSLQMKDGRPVAGSDVKRADQLV